MGKFFGNFFMHIMHTQKFPNGYVVFRFEWEFSKMVLRQLYEHRSHQKIFWTQNFSWRDASQKAVQIALSSVSKSHQNLLELENFRRDQSLMSSHDAQRIQMNTITVKIVNRSFSRRLHLRSPILRNVFRKNGVLFHEFWEENLQNWL